jgi:hypothetical protein
MSNLAWALNQLQQKNRDGSIATQRDRRKILKLISVQLKKLGYNQMNTKALKEKHVLKLVTHWKGEKISVGTIKNRLSHIRWWAKTMNIAQRIPSNKELKIGSRSYIPESSKAVQLSNEILSKIPDGYLKYSIRLQQEFGLRREESIKFIVSYADKGSHILLKDTWCKGKRARSIPVKTEAQRNNYAQQRYLIITGNNPPFLGGKAQREMTKPERAIDTSARLTISNELGHGRVQITSTYLGT